MFFNGRQKVFAYSSGLKDFYDLKLVAFLHFDRFILIFGFKKKNVFPATLKAKYQNDPNKVKECHMFQVIEIFQARGICKYFLTGLKEHTVDNTYLWIPLPV